MPDYYEILGVDEDASQQDIKRAYFRLIRSHTPDADPEGFMRIREAYEALRSGKKPDGPRFAALTDPIAETVRGEIEKVLHTENMARVAELAEYASKHYPNEPYFFYQLQKALRRIGKTGKSVTAGEKLLKLDPENPWYNRELAISYLERGYIKKAITRCEKAYALGVRDPEFICMFVNESENRYYFDFSFSLLKKYLQEKTEWSADEMTEAGNLYMHFVHFGELSSSSGEEVFEKCLAFFEKYLDSLGEGKEDMLFTLISRACRARISDSLLNRIMKFGEDQIHNFPEEMQDTIRYILKQRENARIWFDESIPMPMRYLTALDPAGKSKDLLEYEKLDYYLLLMKLPPEHALFSVRMLKRKYPEAYRKHKEFYDLLENRDGFEEKMDEYRAAYRNLSLICSGGDFYEKYPEEKRRAVKNKAYGTPSVFGKRGKYSRAIVGRNEPCPCGSGKKFKKCCMGKGIFD